MAVGGAEVGQGCLGCGGLLGVALGAVPVGGGDGQESEGQDQVEDGGVGNGLVGGAEEVFNGGAEFGGLGVVEADAGAGGAFEGLGGGEEFAAGGAGGEGGQDVQ